MVGARADAFVWTLNINLAELFFFGVVVDLSFRSRSFVCVFGAGTRVEAKRGGSNDLNNACFNKCAFVSVCVCVLLCARISGLHVTRGVFGLLYAGVQMVL